MTATNDPRKQCKGSTKANQDHRYTKIPMNGFRCYYKGEQEININSALVSHDSSNEELESVMLRHLTYRGEDFEKGIIDVSPFGKTPNVLKSLTPVFSE